MTTTTIILSVLLLGAIGIIIISQKSLSNMSKIADIHKQSADNLRYSMPIISTAPAKHYYARKASSGSWQVIGAWTTWEYEEYFEQAIKWFNDPDEDFNRREAEYLVQILNEK